MKAHAEHFAMPEIAEKARTLARERMDHARLPESLQPLAPSRIALSRGPAPEGTQWAPSPPGALPILGHVKTIRQDPAALLRHFAALRNSYGDVVRLQFGSLDAHVISCPDLIRQVLHEHHRQFSKETRGIYKLRLVLGNGLLTSQGSSWLRNRRIAQPAFHRKRIASFATTMASCADAMLEGWSDGEERDLHHEMMKVTLRIIGLTMLSLDVEAKADEIGDAVSFVVEDLNRRLNAMVDIPLPLPTARNRALQSAIETLDRVVLEAIAARRTQPPKDDLLGLFMAAQDAETGEQMSDAQLRDEVMTIFLAGHETTANALAWTLYLLGKYPAIARDLRAEADAVLGDGSMLRTSDDDDARGAALMEALSRLTLTEKVLKESMRLYPPVWITARAPVGDQVLGGFHMPDQSLVLASPWITHRHPDHWDNPEGFDPERFAPEREKARARFAYFPFGGGPRICIGNHFAMMEAKLILAAIALRYRADLVPGHRVDIEPVITLRPLGGLPMKLRERNA